MRNGIDQRIEIKGRQIGIFCFDVDYVWSVIPAK